MKHLLLGSLPLVLLSMAAISPAQAQITPEALPANTETIGMAITPFDLVFLAYQGYLEDEGIPRFNALITRHQEGNLQAEDLIRAGINTQRLSPNTLNNHRYTAAVEQQLDSLDGNRNH